MEFSLAWARVRAYLRAIIPYGKAACGSGSCAMMRVVPEHLAVQTPPAAQERGIMKRIAFLVWMGLLLLAACAPPPSPLTTPEPTTPAPPAASTDMPIPDVQTAPRSPPGTPAPAPPIFGEPVNLGRGGIQDADFSRDASRLAIGWTNGVSVIQVDDLAEQWYVPLPEVVI